MQEKTEKDIDFLKFPRDFKISRFSRDTDLTICITRPDHSHGENDEKFDSYLIRGKKFCPTAYQNLTDPKEFLLKIIFLNF